MKLSVLLVLGLALSIQVSAQDWEEDYEDETEPYWTEADEQGGYEEDYTGPECDDPDGLCTSTRIGNIRYGYDGSNSQRVGRRTYYSNGTVCTTIRNTTYCY